MKIPDEKKIYAFAQRMAQQLYEMRGEDMINNLDLDDDATYTEEYANKIMDDPEHAAKMKGIINAAIVDHLGHNPTDYVNEAGDDYEYTTDVYDYSFHIDAYIQREWDKEREARLIKKWKVWVEIERIETDPVAGDEDYIDEEIPFGIAYVDSLEAALELRENINKTFGEINPPLP